MSYTRRTLIAFAAVFAAGAALRSVALQDGFWLDEIWSVHFASAVSGPLGILTEIHYDNNHYLQTFWMWLLGPTPHWTLYRLPSLAAGLISIALAFWAGRRLAGELGGALAAAFFAFGYPMLHYGTEARGYALAALFALAGYCLLIARELEPRRRAAAFAVVAALGLLSHLTFAFFLAAAWAWLSLQALQRRLRLSAIDIAAYFLLPLATLAALYLLDVRHIQIGIGGGEHRTLEEVVASFLGYGFGFPRYGLAFWAGTLGLAAVVVHGVRALHRQDRDQEAALALLCLPLPLFGLAFMSGPVLVERYLFIALPFLYLLAAAAIADLRHSGVRQKVAGALALTVFFAGSLAYDGEFLLRGRGHYRAAVEYLAANDPAPVIEAASDQPWRNGMVADYYSVFLPAGRRLVVSNHRTKANPPSWFLAHRIQDEDPEPPETFNDPLGDRFRLAARFDKWGLSGFRWFLYRRETPHP